MLLFTDNRGGPHSKLTTLEPSAEEDGVLAAKCNSSLTNTGLHANDSTERKYNICFSNIRALCSYGSWKWNGARNKAYLVCVNMFGIIIYSYIIISLHIILLHNSIAC